MTCLTSAAPLSLAFSPSPSANAAATIIPTPRFFVYIRQHLQSNWHILFVNILDKCASPSPVTRTVLQPTYSEVYSSSYSAAAYLRSIDFKQKAYVVGEQGIVDELADAGIRAIGGPADAGKQIDWAGPNPELQQDEEVGAVVVGVDYHLSYYKVHYASLCLLQNPNCLFIATNTDSRGNFSQNQEWPGAGSAVGAIKGATDLEPTVTGKPAAFMLDDICRCVGATVVRLALDVKLKGKRYG